MDVRFAHLRVVSIVSIFSHACITLCAFSLTTIVLSSLNTESPFALVRANTRALSGVRLDFKRAREVRINTKSKCLAARSRIKYMWTCLQGCL